MSLRLGGWVVGEKWQRLQLWTISTVLTVPCYNISWHCIWHWKPTLAVKKEISTVSTVARYDILLLGSGLTTTLWPQRFDVTWKVVQLNPTVKIGRLGFLYATLTVTRYKYHPDCCCHNFNLPVCHTRLWALRITDVALLQCFWMPGTGLLHPQPPTARRGAQTTQYIHQGGLL